MLNRAKVKEVLQEGRFSHKILERIFELHDHKYGSKAEWLKAIQYDILRWANGNWSEQKQVCKECGQEIKC